MLFPTIIIFIIITTIYCFQIIPTQFLLRKEGNFDSLKIKYYTEFQKIHDIIEQINHHEIMIEILKRKKIKYADIILLDWKRTWNNTPYKFLR